MTHAEVTYQRSTSAPATGEITVADVRFEHLRGALGIGTARPRISWIIANAPDDWRQAGYEIESLAADDRPRAQTGKIDSPESVLLDWPFAPLASRERLTLRVRVWGADGRASAWSVPAQVEAGLLAPGDWDARFVTPDWDEDTSKAQPGPLLRHEFEVRAGVTRARLYVTALGVYEAQLNGATAGDHVLAPG